MTDSDTFCFDLGPAQIGPYAVRGVLGEGAMSIVYAAEAGDGGDVAVKVLRGELLAGPERASILARFRREAEIGTRLDHPHIVRILDHGDWRGSPWLSMEMVAGRDLKRMMDAGDRLTPTQAATLVLRVLDALAAAHAAGVVHRDVKPANVMVEDGLAPKLMDFGIAHVAQSDLTMRDELLGSPAYMAPEVLRGEGADARSDLFSAGVILYALLARRRPFSGTVAEVMRQILFEEPPPPSRVDPLVPAVFDGVVATALAKDPARRFPTADAFAQALRNALAAAGDAAEATGVLVFEDASWPTAAPDAGDAAEALRALLKGLPAGTLGEKALAEAARLLDAAVRRAPAARAVALDSVIVDEGLAPLAALIRAGMPAPGAAPGAVRADWMALVRLFARLAEAAVARGLQDAAVAATQEVAVALNAALADYARRLDDLLAADDNPDLAVISADFLRLDVLLLALEVLRADHAAAQGALAVFAARVMRKVNATIAGFLAEVDDGAEGGAEDGVARFGVAVLLSEVESLLDLAARLLDADPGPGLGDDLGEADVAAFLAHARALAGRVAAELRAEPDAAVFGGRLKALAALYTVATRLPSGAVLRQPLAALTQELYAQVSALLDAIPAAEPERIEAVYDMAEALGWSEVQRAAVTALRRRLVARG
ncbi:serine/threonine-protein kinase [Azospirillum sp.]|uniref:serine/threonine-protein kinase n=1 Tax=Azospirillum sp. TaxID=34012 RepID=UPI002D24F8B8|nr:serine/threonine-protein kinase [Azospirillum sp.]HYD66802.1 serine/threonine-protein kinase [Azospirillum sp.]